jgi:hypothetical protein
MRLLSRRLLLCTLAGLSVVGAVASVHAVQRQRAATAISAAAQAFLTSLTPEERQRATFPLVSDEWTRWHFIPVTQFERHGLPLKAMTDAQRQLARRLLEVSVSQSGYQTATGIMALENVLGALEDQQRAVTAAEAAAPAAAGRGRGAGAAVIPRDPTAYFFSIFGDPKATAGWGWRVEGHHVSLHFAVDNGKMQVTSTPLFFGTNPARVPAGPQEGLRILGPQEDAGRALVASLDDAEKAVAIYVPNPPGDIATANNVNITPLTPTGLAASAMTPAQRELLSKLIETYSSAMLPEVAADRMAKMRAAGMEKITFAWAGSTEKGQRYYYRVQGPTFLIEHNNTQNNGNHIHSVWRDFNGDFGRDLLAEHMAAFAH